MPVSPEPLNPVSRTPVTAAPTALSANAAMTTLRVRTSASSAARGFAPVR